MSIRTPEETDELNRLYQRYDETTKKTLDGLRDPNVPTMSEVMDQRGGAWDPSGVTQPDSLDVVPRKEKYRNPQ